MQASLIIHEYMKIVQINTVCGTGSTGKIAVALHNISISNSHESYIAYGRGKCADNIPSYKIGNVFDFFTHVLINFFKGKSGFGSKTVTKRFIKWLDTIQPDILHLHNLHGFYINIELFFDYIKRKNIPVVLTLHDCWTFTGQCAHFDYVGCSKWKTQCHHCPIFRTNYPYSLFKDNSAQNYIQKQELLTGISNMVIVTPSKWLAELVSDSFLSGYPVKTIPNGIDLQIFRPYPAKTISSKKIILGVANVWTERKGYHYFLELAKAVGNQYQIVLIGVSQKQKQKLQRNYPEIIPITRTQNQKELAQWYSNAFVYVNPTLEDTFPTTNLEALACGTPVITFKTGGSPEAISDNCGIVVEKGDLDGLISAISHLEKEQNNYKETCRSQAMNYQSHMQYSKYLEIYHTLSHS